MKLASTVTRFSTTEFRDAYSPTATFMGRIEPFNESKNPGVSSHRRVLEVAPTVVVPNTKVIVDAYSQTYIVGSRVLDYWRDTVIRHKYALIPTGVSGDLGDIGEILAGTPAETSVYAFPYFTRRESTSGDRSSNLSGYDLYFPDVYSLAAGDVFVSSGVYYRLDTDSALDGVGFLFAQVTKIESPIQSFDIKVSGTAYDPVTDSYSETTHAAIDCFVEPLIKDYEFVTPAFEKIEAGDKAISVLESDVAVESNDFIGGYRVLSTRDMGAWRICHCRFENR